MMHLTCPLKHAYMYTTTNMYARPKAEIENLHQMYNDCPKERKLYQGRKKKRPQIYL